MQFCQILSTFLLSFKKNMETSGEPDDKSLACEICHKVFSCKKFLRGHFLNHTRERPHVCDVCGKKFPFPKDLKRHKLIHTGERDFVCDICNQTFARNYSLTAHKRLHSGEKPYECEICCKSFSRKYQLLVHQQAEQIRVFGSSAIQQNASMKKEKNFMCDVCNKRFSKKSSLNKHKYVHMEDKPFVCNLCNMGFSQKSYMVRHIYKHTGERPFVCDFCQKGFTRKGGLIEHLRIHTGEKPFECEICHFRFAHSSHYRRHVSKYHGSAGKEGNDNAAERDADDVAKQDNSELDDSITRSEDSSSNQGYNAVIVKQEENIVFQDYESSESELHSTSTVECDEDITKQNSCNIIRLKDSSSFTDHNGIIMKQEDSMIIPDCESQMSEQDSCNSEQDDRITRLDYSSSNQGNDFIDRNGIVLKQEDSIIIPDLGSRVSSKLYCTVKYDNDITKQGSCNSELGSSVTRLEDSSSNRGCNSLFGQSGTVIKQEDSIIIPDYRSHVS